MAISFKSQVLALDLAEAFTRRFSPTLAVTLTPDATSGFEGAPLIKVGPQTAGSQSACIRIKQIDPITQNSIGQTDEGFTPHVAQVVLETSTIANVSLLTAANILPLLAELGHRGLRVELYLSANTNAVGPEDITSGNLKLTYDNNTKWKAQVGQ